MALVLPQPKYTGEDEESSRQRSGPRVVGPGHIHDTRLIRTDRSGPPPYGQRSGWRPRTNEDFGDGGAFPEIPVAQYPAEMGKKSTASNNVRVISPKIMNKHNMMCLTLYFSS
jgi:SNW domain-containing protein 1